MSGIALVLHLDGRPASAADLAPMLADMARRGPDGEDVALAGPVAFGHRHLPTTPEALTEPMPLADPRTGCLLSGDIRLDNRDALLTVFGLRDRATGDGIGDGIGDGTLVLHAWERWGEECATHLLGDFAFALWDPRRRRVFAARDQMGMRQLAYAHQPGRVFVCATSARAVARQPRIGAGLDDLRLAEALIGFEHGRPTATFHEGVLRLPPAHCLTVTGAGLTVRPYWQLTAPAPLRLKSDADYADAFREVLSTAVRARLRGAGPVGSMLSGGLDSGAIVALASRMVPGPLPTFSSVGPSPDACVETRAIHRALTLPNLAPTLVSHDALEPWRDDLIGAWLALDEPWDFHMTQPRTAYLAAQRAGVRVVLDGVAGDALLDEGNQMEAHLRSGQILRAVRDARGLSAFFGLGPRSSLAQVVLAARRAFTPLPLRRWRASGRAGRLPALPPGGIVDPAFADRIGLRQVLRDWQAGEPPERLSFADSRLRDYPRSGLTAGRERYDRVAAHFGIEPRDPFMDRRLWDFCLSLPADQFQAGGWPKVLLRRAMAGLLPDEVIWRHSKEHLGYEFTCRLFALWPDWTDAVRPAQGLLTGKAVPGFDDPCHIAPSPLTGDSDRSEILLQTALFLAAQGRQPDV